MISDSRTVQGVLLSSAACHGKAQGLQEQETAENCPEFDMNGKLLV